MKLVFGCGYAGRVSPRLRTALIAAAVAALAAVVVAGAAVLTAEEVENPAASAPAPQPREGRPPLVLELGLRDDAEARELREAARLYEAGEVEEAAAIFARHDSLEAKLGTAFTQWPGSLDRVEQLGALYPRSALVQLHVGLARFWAGVGRAQAAWREARDVEPDTPYAVRAADLIHADRFAPGLPIFTPSFAYSVEGATGEEQLEVLRRRLGVRARLVYGIFMQRLGKPVSARRAFAEAVELEPGNVDALVADAVGRYEKNDPSRAFSRLGPLSRRFPQAATVRFHLGLLLLWQGDVAAARRQLRLAQRLEPGSRIAREAGRFLREVERAGTP